MTVIQRIAQQIGISSSFLVPIVLHSDRYYNAYYKPKRSAGLRQIQAPNVTLKAIQSWILLNILEKVPVSDRAQGFVRERGICSHATYHVGKRYILIIDIKDFFPSIGIDKVYDVFSQVVNDSDTARIYAILCTFRNRLPQGGVTSPTLSNLVFRSTDDTITDLCSRMHIAYSRYADDLTFSSNDFQALKQLYGQVEQVIQSAGFKINTKKTRYCSRNNRMLVTGLRLNSDKLTTGRQRKRIIRAQLYNHFVNHDESVNMNSVLGHIAFIRGIEDDYYPKVQEYVARLIAASTK
jgi:RNA-directed DNA polymerase